MGQIQFKDGKILFVDGKIAFDPACCCEQSDCCWLGPPANFLEARAANNTVTHPFATFDVGGKGCGGCHDLSAQWWLLESAVPGGLNTGCAPIDNFHLDPAFGGVGNILGYWFFDGYLCTFSDVEAPCSPEQSWRCCPDLDGYDVNVAIVAIAYRHPSGSPTGCRIALRQCNYNPPGTPVGICWYNTFGPGGLDGITPSLCATLQLQLQQDSDWSSPYSEDACQGCWKLATNSSYLLRLAA